MKENLNKGIKTVAVIGATGMLGSPVAKALKAAGFKVRVIGRDIEKLGKHFDANYQHFEADIHNRSSLRQALAGCDAVHINLSGHTDESCHRNQVVGTQRIVEAAKVQGLNRITFLSGTTSELKNTWHYDTQAKVEAEKIIKNSGLSYIVFCPSWFMETLPLFVNNGRATVFGKTSQPVKWLSAKEYAAIVVESYQQQEVLNQRLHIHGPEGIDISSAVKLYAEKEGLKFTGLPYWVGNLLARLSHDDVLKDAVALLRYYETVGEKADAVNTGFTQPKTTLSQWLSLQA